MRYRLLLITMMTMGMAFTNSSAFAQDNNTDNEPIMKNL